MDTADSQDADFYGDDVTEQAPTGEENDEDAEVMMPNTEERNSDRANMSSGPVREGPIGNSHWQNGECSTTSGCKEQSDSMIHKATNVGSPAPAKNCNPASRSSLTHLSINANAALKSENGSGHTFESIGQSVNPTTAADEPCASTASQKTDATLEKVEIAVPGSPQDPATVTGDEANDDGNHFASSRITKFPQQSGTGINDKTQITRKRTASSVGKPPAMKRKRLLQADSPPLPNCRRSGHNEIQRTQTRPTATEGDKKLSKKDPSCCYIHRAKELSNDLELTVSFRLQEDSEVVLLSGNAYESIIPRSLFVGPPVEIAVRPQPIQDRAFVDPACNHDIVPTDATGAAEICRLCGQRRA